MTSQFRYRRGEFIAVLGGAAAWALTAHAQQPALPEKDFLRSSTLADVQHWATASQGLS
jgi:hypothetical protein